MVIPVVVQDATSKEVLIVAYANDEAVAETFRLGRQYSTAHQEMNCGTKAQLQVMCLMLKK